MRRVSVNIGTMQGGVKINMLPAACVVDVDFRPPVGITRAAVIEAVGAILARYILDLLRIRAWWQRGFALGVASHGIGVSRAFSLNVEAGAYASLAMGLHGIIGAVFIPWIYRLWV